MSNQQLTGARKSLRLCAHLVHRGGVSVGPRFAGASISASPQLVSERSPPPIHCSNLPVVSGGMRSVSAFPAVCLVCMLWGLCRSVFAFPTVFMLACSLPLRTSASEVLVIGHRLGVTAPTGGGCPAAGGQTHLTGYGWVC